MEFRLPQVGENIESAQVGNLRVAVGDLIEPNQIVMEIEADKSVLELPCPHAGKVAKIHVRPGDAVRVGARLLTIDQPEAESLPALPGEPATATPANAQASGEGAAQDLPAQPQAASVQQAALAPAAPTELPETGQVPPAPAGPATRRLARELGVDLHKVQGTGPGSRITPDDVREFVKASMAGGLAGPRLLAGVLPPLPDFSQFGPIERQPLNTLARAAAANLSLAWSVVPHVTQHELADVTELEAARKRYAQTHPAREGSPKITMTVLVIKALVTALKAFPKFNASLDAAAGQLILKRYFHVGVAVDTEGGLLVPVIRNADAKSVLQLAADLADLAERARQRKATLADLQGGTFTVTNLGGIGGSAFTPIVNYPEVAILGLSRVSQQQVVIDGRTEIRLMLPLSLSYDHRVINGADAARFIVKLAGLLSDPFQLLSEV
jgi:pyruvate dehydrogenase E2 component (dihydrolipoamide acetyltransferase)